jgi:hypothetical protein
VIALIALLALQVASNDELKYAFPLPEGFVAFPEARTQPDIVDCWTEAMPASPNGALVMCVHRLRGVLPREAMRAQDLPPSTRLVAFTWKGFEIQGLRTDTVQAGGRVTVLVAQLPLKPEAVQLVVAGPADQGDRMETIMTSALAAFEGETNWLTSTERSSRLGKGVGAMLALGVLAIAVRIWRTRRAQTA